MGTIFIAGDRDLIFCLMFLNELDGGCYSMLQVVQFPCCLDGLLSDNLSPLGLVL